MTSTRPLEWLLATCMVAWGVTMLLPPDRFEMGTYAYMAMLCTESRWGTISILLGLLRWFGLGINGWWRRTPLIRAAGAWAGILWWLAIGFLMWAAATEHGSVLPAGVVYYPVFVLFEAWALLSSARDMQRSRALSLGGSDVARG